jgi:hypothetical protein
MQYRESCPLAQNTLFDDVPGMDILQEWERHIVNDDEGDLRVPELSFF